MGLDPGEFLMDPCFFGLGPTMPVPARYYLVVFAANGVQWTSRVMTLYIGPQDADLGTAADWTCTPFNCQGPDSVFFDWNHGLNIGSFLCAALCHANGGQLTIWSGPFSEICVRLSQGWGGPTVINPVERCQPEHPIADGYLLDNWVWVQIGQDYFVRQTAVLPPEAQEGYIRIQWEIPLSGGREDCWLPVELGSFEAQPGDASVRLSWNTRSENNLERFDILRDGTCITSKPAVNSPTGAHYEYVDRGVQNGTTYTYSLVMVSTDGSSRILATQSATPSTNKAVVTEYALHQNFPNPFNPTTSIRFDLPEDNVVTLKVYNATGQEVASLVNGNRHAGVNIVNFDATRLTSGLYFYTVKVGNVYRATRKMLLIK